MRVVGSAVQGVNHPLELRLLNFSSSLFSHNRVFWEAIGEMVNNELL